MSTQMGRPIGRCALALSFVLVASPVPAQPPSGWSEHRNEKFGFSLKYPAETFKLAHTTAAGDGLAFASENGEARLLVGVLANESGFTPSTYQDYVERESYGKFSVTYRPLRGNWFVLSGEGEGKMFYEKVIFSCSGQLINSFAMIYPVGQRAMFDPIVEGIEKTFRAGDTCAGASAPGNKKRAQSSAGHSASPRLADSSRTRSTPRSALADRIAQERGRDVYVVLQRTTPPYDQKVLRGYAR